jgi:hypothetical protein
VRVCLRRASGARMLLHRGAAMGWHMLRRETERAAAGLGHMCVCVRVGASLSLSVCPCGALAPTEGRISLPFHRFLDGET